jgi:hypothetical protein
VLWACDDGLLHISVLYSDDPCFATALFDESSSAVKTAMRHAHLLSTIEDDSDSVACCVFVKNTGNIQSSLLVSTTA